MVESRKEINRKRNVADILKATATLIAEKGVHNVSVDEIAKAADFGKGTLYNYFKNKDDIIWSLVEQLFSEFRVQIELSVDASLHIKDKMKEVLLVSNEYFEKQEALNEILAFLEYSSWQTQNKAVFQNACDFFDSFHKPFEQMFKEAMSRGEIGENDARYLSILFFTNLTSIKKALVRGDMEMDKEKIVALVLNTFFEKL